MNYPFLKYLLIIFVAAAANTNSEAKNGVQTILSQQNFSTSLYNGQNSSHFPSFYFLNNYNAGQILRSQTQRTVNFLKGPVAITNKFNAYFRFLSNNFCSTSVGYVRSCKLILFPFHVFW